MTIINEKIEELKTHIQQLTLTNDLKRHVKSCWKNLKFKLKRNSQMNGIIVAKELNNQTDKAILEKRILKIKKQNITNQSQIEESEL